MNTTTESQNPAVATEQRAALRELARQYQEIAASGENHERIRLWKCHNRLQPERPMILLFPEGGWGEIGPSDPALTMVMPQGHPLHAVEWHMRQNIYAWRHFASDNVVDPEIPVARIIWDTGWGVEAKWIHSELKGGSRTFDPVINDFSDLKKLRLPEVLYDEVESNRRFALAQDVIGDLVPLRQRGIRHFSCHFMALWTSWRGLEETMMDMAAEPELVHEAMAFIEKGYHGLIRQYTDMNLFDFNNDNTYHSSGGNGWTDELPQPDCDPGRPRPRDLWASAESQELTLVSPQMHEEFALQYERRIIEQFGLSGYACCDDLTHKLEHVKKVANMRRISIAPVASVDRCAPQLGGKYIFSWKPNPAHLVGNFNPERIAAYIRHTLEVAREHGCVLEMILKDTHTCENHPERFDLWSRIARSEVER